RSDPIVPVGRSIFTGAGQVFQSVFVDLTTPVAWRPITVITSPVMRDYVERTPGAFGYVDLALTEPVHVINYEGVGCTRATYSAASSSAPTSTWASGRTGCGAIVPASIAAWQAAITAPRPWRSPISRHVS